MSEAPRSTASLITRCTSWMTDASSPPTPKLIGAFSRKSYIGAAGGVLGARGELGVGRVLLLRRDGAVAEVGVLEALRAAARRRRATETAGRTS